MKKIKELISLKNNIQTPISRISSVNKKVQIINHSV